LEIYFPETFKNKAVVYNATKLDYLNSRIDKILGTANDQDIKRTEYELLKQTKSGYWNPQIEGNSEVAMEREFQKLLIIMGQNTNRDVQKLTVLEFYSLKDYIIESNRKDG
jgi:hypothetical protein